MEINPKFSIEFYRQTMAYSSPEVLDRLAAAVASGGFRFPGE